MAKKSYLSNVLKSIKYATIDTVAEMNPVIVEQYSSSKDFVKETIDEVKEKSKQKKDNSSNYVKDTIRTTYKNLKEDLKSGNFYNKARIEEEETKAMAKVFDMDLNFDMDFDMDDAFNENDDFNFDDDFGDDSSGNSSSESSNSNNDPFAAKVMAIAMGQTTSAIKRSNSRSVNALGGLMVETSKFNADVIAASTERMLTGVSVAGGMIHNDLVAINTNLGNVVQFSNEVLRTHIENSTTFFETQKQQMQEQTELLKEIRDMQASVYKPKDTRYRSDKVDISDIFGSEGSLDLRQYKQYLKENGGAGGSDGGMIGMVGQFLPLIMSSVTGSPLSLPLKGIINKAIGEDMENIFKSLNDTIAGVISTSLVNLTQAQKGHNGGFFQWLGDMFGLKIPSFKMDLSKYDTGPTAWTGKDHKALTEVIPTWLSKIYSGVTGKDEQRYNYKTGKFENLSEIRKAQDKEYKYAVARANQSINEELNKGLNKIRFSNEDDKKAIVDAIEKIQRYNFKEMKNFNPNSKRAKDLDPKTYGIEGANADKVMEIVRMLYSDADKKAQMKGSHELLSSVSSYNRTIREQEAEGDSVYNALFNNSIDESKIHNSPIMASAKRLDTTNALLQHILDAVSTPQSTIITNTVSRVSMDGTPESNSESSSKTDTTKSVDNKNTKKDDKTFDLNTDDPKKVKEMLKNEQNEDKKETDGYLQQIEKGNTASEKLKAFFKGFTLLTKKPTAFLKSTLDTIDVYAYSLFFGDGEGDVHSVSDKLLKGFDNVFAKIGNKVNGIFTDIKEEIKKEGKATAGGIFKAVFGVDLKDFSKEFKTAMFGDPNESFFKGMGRVMKKGFGEIIHDIFGGVKDSVTNFFSADDGEGLFKKGLNEVDKMGNKYSENKKKEEEEKKKRESGEQDILESSAATKKDDEEKKKKNKPIDNAAAGLKVTRTGLVAVSEGERIVPKYANAASIAGRQLKENSAINKFKKAMGLGSVKLDSFATGGTVGEDDNEEGIVKEAGGITYSADLTYSKFNEFYNALPDDKNREYYRKKFAKDYAENMVDKAKTKGAKTAQDAIDQAQNMINNVITNNPALADEIKSQIDKVAKSKFVSKATEYTAKGVKGAKSFAGAVGQEAKNAGSALKDAFTTGDDSVSEAFRKLGKRFSPNEEAKSAFTDVVKNWKDYLPKAIAGSATGASLSVLFGLAGGPIVGAAIGAATALVTKSDALQKLLFGEKELDENGNVKGRAGGLFSKELSSNVQKYFPGMAKSAAIGGLLSVLPFVPGGPVSGILIGSAVGFARSNESIREALFGKDDLIAKAGKYVKQRLPKMGLGAAVGALTGPFGITTNLMIGAGLGLVSDTEKFKRMVFGTKDVDGNYRGGLIGNIKKVLEVPLNGLSNLIDDTREFFNNEIYEPLRKSANIFLKQFQNMFLWIGDKIADSFTKHVWGPIGSIITNKFLVPFEKFIGGLFKGALGLGKWTIKKALSPITGLAGIVERSQLNSIGYGAGTAEERVLRRQQIIDEYQAKADNAKFFKWKKQRKANKIRKQLTNSESAAADNYLSASTTTTDELQQALLVSRSLGPVGALGGAKSAVRKYARGVLKKTGLNETLNAHVANDDFSDKYRKAIIKEVEKGEYKRSVDLIMNHTPKLKPETREKLCAVIKEAAKEVATGIKKAENAQTEKDKIEAKLGFKIGGHATQRVLEQAIRERGGDVSKGKVVDTGEDGNLPVPETPAEKFLSRISDDVHTIAEGFLKTHEKNLTQPSTAEQAGMGDFVSSGSFGILNGNPLDITSGVKYTDTYEYTENGIVKMHRNDQGELEPDEQDSQTRATLKKKNENDETQKGILSKLTGIGNSVLEFFGKKEEPKKENIFQKILSTLGIGFSFLGGGNKIFGALKAVGALAGIGFVFGKKVPEKDSEGNPVFDDYGNPVYTSIANIIWDKVSPIFTKMKKWWVDKAWPAVKTFTLKEVIPAIGDGIKTIWDGLGDVSGKILDWTFDVFIPELIDRLPGILLKAADKAKNFICKVLGIKTSDIEDATSTSEAEKTTEALGYSKEDNGSAAVMNPAGTTNITINNIGNGKNQFKKGTNTDGTSTKINSDAQIKYILQSTEGYKNIESDAVEQKIKDSKDISKNWNKIYKLPDGTELTLGEILTTPGYKVGTAKTGDVYSQDLLANPNLLNAFTDGDVADVLSTNKELEDNTIHYDSSKIERLPKAALIQAITKGQLPNFGLKAAEAINRGMHKATQAGIGVVPWLSPYLKAVAIGADRVVEAGTNIPLIIARKSNQFFRNKAEGMSTKDAFFSALKKSKKKEKAAAEAAKKTTSTPKVKVNQAAIDKVYLNPSDVLGTDTAIGKIVKWLSDKLTDSKILNRIKEKINNGVCKATNFKDITNEKLSKLMKAIATKISNVILGRKDKDTIIQQAGNKIAEALGTAGTQIIATAVLALLDGMMCAHTYFVVEEANLAEVIVGGIANVISQTLLFGLIEPQDVIPTICDLLADGGYLDLEDLQKRQEQVEIAVAEYNAKNRENLSPYDYLMKDTIKGKINAFVKSTKIGQVLASDADIATDVVASAPTASKLAGKGFLSYFLDVIPGTLEDTGYQGGNFFDNLARRTEMWKESLANSSEAKSLKETYNEAYSKRSEMWNKVLNKKKESEITGYNALVDVAGVPDSANKYSFDSLMINGLTPADKTLDIVSSAYGLSTTDFTGETNDYAEQADKNRETVNNFTSTWDNIDKQTTPFFSSLTEAMSKAQKAVSKNMAVALGLADAKDEDVDFIKIVNDSKYLLKRAQTIQDNSAIATLFSGYTGSNSNDSKIQDAAAVKVAQAANNGKVSGLSAITTSTKNIINNALKSSTSSKLNVKVYSGATAAAFGSGIKNNDIAQNTPPSENEFVSQKYGKYANMTFGIGTQREKVSEAGCAPSTAVMTINSNLGGTGKLDMSDALKHASRYIASNGGVTPDYFADEFRRYGFKTAYISKEDKNRQEVMKYQLLNGKSIVLMGRNTGNNSKTKSPFGPNYHYVVATGMSADGKYIYISDPESKTPNVKYRTEEIFNNTDLSIIPVQANGRIRELAGRLKTNLKNLSGKSSSGIIFVGDSRTEGLKNAVGTSNKKLFISSDGGNLEWFKSEGMFRLKQLATKYPDYYVVINLGIEDLDNVREYIDYYKNTLSKSIKNQIFYLSVNPVDESKRVYKIKNTSIRSFNSQMGRFAGAAYINTFTTLLREGFTANDGLHYSAATYRKIYNLIVDAVNSKAKSTNTNKDTNNMMTLHDAFSGGFWAEINDSSSSTSNSSSVTSAIESTSDTVSSTADDYTSTSSSSSSTSVSSGKHIRSFADLISAISSILSGTYGLSSSEASSLTGDSSLSTSTISTDGISGRVSSDPNVAKVQKQLVAQMKSVEGKLKYAQNNAKYPGSRNPDDGSGDCSSTVQWAYKKVTGKDIGDWTGAQNESSATTFIEQPHTRSAFDESKLQLGDILLYGNNAGAHVEMYYGNGKTIGHGSGYGPKIKDITYRTRDCWSAKRLNEFMPSGKGTGLFISQNDSKWRSKKIGDETVSQAGCAPAVATMAIDNSKEYNMDKAIKDAKDYKTEGNGVTADYFINTFKKQGYNTIVLTSKKKIIQSLKQGNNAVLIGQDANNKSKRRSPFGPSSHYVLATGISKDEKDIFINDPENSEPNIKYDTNTVLNAVKVAIIPVTLKGGRIDRFNEQLTKALQGYNGRATNVGSAVITALRKMEAQRKSDKAKGIVWKYTNRDNIISSTFSIARNNGTRKTCYCNGPHLVLWALRKAGIIKSSSNNLIVSSDGGLSGAAWYDIKNNCSIRSYAKTAKELMNSSILKPGDIVTFRTNSRIMVYAGGQSWYDGGNMNLSNGEYKSWLVYSVPNSQVRYVISKKETNNGTTKSITSSSTSGAVSNAVSNAADTVTDTSSTASDDTTTSSEDTFLDKLVKSFALLAEGWGLTSSQADSTVSDSTSTGSSTKVTGKTAKAKIWNYFHDKGIPDAGIAGVMGNIQQESDFQFDCIESNYNKDVATKYAQMVNSGQISKSQFLKSPTINGRTYGPGYGLVQWTDNERKGGYYDATKGKGLSIDDPQGALDCLWGELQIPYYKKSLDAIKTGTVREATLGFMNNYERPAAQYANAEGRVKYANAILKEMTGKGSGLGSIGITGTASSAISSINRNNSDNETKELAKLDKLMKADTGLNSVGIASKKTSKAIRSINRNNSGNNTLDIPSKLSLDDFVGKGSGIGTDSAITPVTNAKVATTQVRQYVNNSSSDVNTLLAAIIKLLAQAVDNTSSIQSIADAVITLVDTKAEAVTDTTTKKQLLDTKAQMLSLIRQQNNASASTSIGDLILDMEAITSR